MAIKCKICGFEAKSLRALAAHLYKHNLKTLDYYIKYENFEIPKCKYCNNTSNFKGGIKFSKTCGKDECISKIAKEQVWTKESIEKARKNRFNYLKKKMGQTAFERRQQGKMSYLEQWFYDNAIEKHKLYNKYDIVNEYPFYPYFIDFAFLNMNIAVELDGGRHFVNGKRTEHDIRRQDYLIDKGWSVFRISFKEMNEEIIKKFLIVLEKKQETPKILNNFVYKGTLKEKSRSRDQYFEEKRNKTIEIEKEKSKIVKNSDIDFSKRGWSDKVSKLVSIRSQKVANFMRKYLPEIYEKQVRHYRLSARTQDFQSCKLGSIPSSAI